MTLSTKPAVHNLSQRRRRVGPFTKIGEDRTYSSGDMLADGQTDRQTNRHAHRSTPPPPRGQSKYAAYYAVYRSCRLPSDYGTLFVRRSVQGGFTVTTRDKSSCQLATVA